jgi:D-lactate dehydrogenase (cytochrome)
LSDTGRRQFQCLPLVDTNSAEEVAKVRNSAIVSVARALAMNGTCTGEHGVGTKEMKYLETELARPR